MDIIINQTVEATFIHAIKEDDTIVLDPVYGRERVLHATPYVLGNGVVCIHLQVDHESFDGNGRTTRFVVRGSTEPVLRMVAI